MYRNDASADRTILIVAYSGRIFGLERASGQILWAHRLDTAGLVVEFEILGQVVVAVTGGLLAFLDYRSGQILKSVTLPAGSRPTLLVDEGQIFIAVNGEMLCFTPTGDRVWFQPFTGHGYGTIACGLPGNIRQADKG